MRLVCDSRNWPRQQAEKNGETQSTSSWAAKRRWSGPTQMVTMAELRLLASQSDTDELLSDFLS